MRKIIVIVLLLILSSLELFGMPPKPGIPQPVFPEGVEKPNKLAVKPGANKATWNCLVILIDYANTSPTQSVASFNNMMFGTWTPGSVADYYNEVSYGQFSITGPVVGWYEAANNNTYYTAGGGYGTGTYPQNAPRLVEEAVDAAQAAGVNFSLYDNDNDGQVESMFIVHRGPGAEETGSTNDIWSHKWAISSGGGTARYYDGKWINIYSIEPEIHSDGSHIDIGVFCHEYAHLLGLPDLYDYNNGSWSVINDANDNPVCDWDLMASGSWGNGDGSIPSHFTAWSKWQLGWINPTQALINNSASTTIYDIEEYQNSISNPSFLIVYPNNNPLSNQYFILEYRRTESRATNNLFDHYDSDYWSSSPALQLDQGLLITHIDDTQPDGGGRWNDGSPNNSNYGIWVEAAGYNPAYNNAGFPEWTFQSGLGYEIKTGAAFGDVVDQMDFGNNLPISSAGWYWPNSRRYNGSNTGIEILDIGVADPPGGPTMSMKGLEIPTVSIELSSFTAKTSLKGVLLQWRTESEYNTFKWLVERTKASRKEYEQISTVESKGNSPKHAIYRFEDEGVKNGEMYLYRLKRIDKNGIAKIFGPISAKTRTFLEKISRIYPQPFNEKVTFEYRIMENTISSLSIYSSAGRLIRILDKRKVEPGTYKITWDGRDKQNKKLPAGVYFCKLTTDQSSSIAKIIKIE